MHLLCDIYSAMEEPRMGVINTVNIQPLWNAMSEKLNEIYLVYQNQLACYFSCASSLSIWGQPIKIKVY